MSEAVESTAPGEPLFRASKRRRVYRRRGSDTDDKLNSASPFSPISPPAVDLPSDFPEAHDADVPRRARPSKPRRLGVAFSSNNSTRIPSRALPQDEVTALALVREPEVSATDEVSKRFAPQTGIVVGKYDKQMDAFVEAEMAKIRAGGSAATRDSVVEAIKSGNRSELSSREATTLGKLQEVELASTVPDSRAIGRSEKGQSATGSGLDMADQLGRNGKPRRKRWRRGSEDVKRDDLVDAILRESKVGMYDEETPKELAQDEGGDEEAFAAQFERQFMENDEKRRQPPPPQSKVAKGDKTEIKGPKLGGSRSARAAMHAQDRAVKR